MNYFHSIEIGTEATMKRPAIILMMGLLYTLNQIVSFCCGLPMRVSLQMPLISVLLALMPRSNRQY